MIFKVKEQRAGSPYPSDNEAAGRELKLQELGEEPLQLRALLRVPRCEASINLSRY